MSEPTARFTRRAPSKRTAPEQCQGCGRPYGDEGPFRFKRRWVCAACLLNDNRVDLADGGLNGYESDS